MGLFRASLLLAMGLGMVSIAEANHLAKKTPEQALKFHQFRMEKLPAIYRLSVIPASSSPLELKVDYKPNKDIQQMMKKSDLLSVMKYRNGQIVINEKSSKLGEDDKMYSMSIAKSFIGYLVGHAVCDGHFASLEDPMAKYVPELKGTIYSDISVGKMIDMAAGDSPIWGKKYNIQEYSGVVLSASDKDRKTILEVIASKPKQSPKNVGDFRYSNAVTDLVARALDTAVPEGLSNYYGSKLSDPAGNKSEMFYYVDANGWPIAHAFLHATRSDYMRMAIKVMSDWSSKTCIGDFLRSQYDQRIKTGNQDFKSYGAFFWFDLNSIKAPIVSMNGHGGQRIIINLKDQSIVSYHAIRSDFDGKKLEKWTLK
jgi:CubicO group peptidase (beta-lactamase class C family)